MSKKKEKCKLQDELQVILFDKTGRIKQVSSSKRKPTLRERCFQILLRVIKKW